MLGQVSVSRAQPAEESESLDVLAFGAALAVPALEAAAIAGGLSAYHAHVVHRAVWLLQAVAHELWAVETRQGADVLRDRVGLQVVAAADQGDAAAGGLGQAADLGKIG